MITLYYAPGTCALATHIALEDAGADYRLRRVDFAKTEQQSPAYVAINPKARVPAMVTPRGVLTETPAMLAFVAQSYPERRLAPLVLHHAKCPMPACLGLDYVFCHIKINPDVLQFVKVLDVPVPPDGVFDHQRRIIWQHDPA